MPETISPEITLYLLEQKQAFSRSLIWNIQERYFSERGINAWRWGEVPHYVTSNPTIAASYAEIVFAFRNDRVKLNPSKSSAPFYLCELGAGSGRFAFHFLTHLRKLCEEESVPLNTFRYVLTDLAESNLVFWKTHPGFGPFFDSGMLDFAVFDVNRTDELVLQQSGLKIQAGDLEQPLIVIANYLFDSVPQEQYYVRDKKCFECLISLASDQEPQPSGAAELMHSLHYRYDHHEITETPFEEPFLQSIFREYRDSLSDVTFLFPAASLRCLERLGKLSGDGMMLLSADKGDHRLDEVVYSGTPGLVYHGSFSVTVNYHAFKLFTEHKNGIALFPDRSHNSVNIGCLLLLPGVAAYTSTTKTYKRVVQDFGPDDFYKLSRQFSGHPEQLSAGSILSFLRLGHYDSQVLFACVPRLAELIAEMPDEERDELKEALEKVWTMYFPLGEPADLAWFIAGLYYEMDDYPKAITYFERSLEIYGPFSGTLCNLAACFMLMEKKEDAIKLLEQVLESEPGNEQANEMLGAIRNTPASFHPPKKS